MQLKRTRKRRINTPQCVLYWITINPEYDDIFTEGYIGVTTNYKERIKQHMAGYRSCFNPSYGVARSEYQVVVVDSETFWDDDTKALVIQRLMDKEELLRPSKGIGLNHNKGGGNAYFMIEGAKKGGQSTRSNGTNGLLKFNPSVKKYVDLLTGHVGNKKSHSTIAKKTGLPSVLKEVEQLKSQLNQS